MCLWLGVLLLTGTLLQRKPDEIRSAQILSMSRPKTPQNAAVEMPQPMARRVVNEAGRSSVELRPKSYKTPQQAFRMNKLYHLLAIEFLFSSVCLFVSQSWKENGFRVFRCH